jgi:hypothetical protein
MSQISHPSNTFLVIYLFIYFDELISCFVLSCRWRGRSWIPDSVRKTEIPDLDDGDEDSGRNSPDLDNVYDEEEDPGRNSPDLSDEDEDPGRNSPDLDEDEGPG